MSEKPYHKYVFDLRTRTFVGRFDEMYLREDTEGFDSWQQEDARHLTRQLSLVVLQRYAFGRILDVGCGKGSFTHLLKKVNNEVVGIDISETAIRKARARYPDVEFRVMGAEQLTSLAGESFDLAVALEVLSYVPGWRDVVKILSTMTRFFCLTLYLPPQPIGFVKSFDELIAEVARHFTVEVELLLNKEALLLLARSQHV